MINKITKTILFTTIAILGITTTTVKAASNTQGMYQEATTVVVDENYCGVSDQEIVIYMMSFGYHIVKMESITGSCNVMCRTMENKCVVVIITEGQITGHEVIIN